MFARVSHTQLLRYAGLFTWGMVGIPLLLTSFYYPPQQGLDLAEAQANFRWWLASYLAFGGGDHGGRPASRTDSCRARDA